jgi:hypothetical protein
MKKFIGSKREEIGKDRFIGTINAFTELIFDDENISSFLKKIEIPPNAQSSEQKESKPNQKKDFYETITFGEKDPVTLRTVLTDYLPKVSDLLVTRQDLEKAESELGKLPKPPTDFSGFEVVVSTKDGCSMTFKLTKDRAAQ